MTLHVVRAVGLVTVQDLGRPGRMHEAIPPGGALVRDLLVAANRAAGNPDPAPALEVCGVVRVRAAAEVEVATTGIARITRTGAATAPSHGAAIALGAGDELELASEPRRVAYLAIRGGIDAPLRLGGRGTLLCAGLGGLVRAGDRLDVAHATTARLRRRAERRAPATDPAVIRVVAGPDPDAFAREALDALTAAPYRVRPDSDRVGTRLAGTAILRAPNLVERTRPLVRGAIEIPGDGLPIVLGPEHPTTGGYPVIAVVASADLDALFSVRLGGAIRFAR